MSKSTKVNFDTVDFRQGTTYVNESNRQTYRYRNEQAHGYRRNLSDLPKKADTDDRKNMQNRFFT